MTLATAKLQRGEAMQYGKGSPDEYPITLVVNGYEIAVFQIDETGPGRLGVRISVFRRIINCVEDIKTVTFHENMGAIHVQLAAILMRKNCSRKRNIILPAADEASHFFQ